VLFAIVIGCVAGFLAGKIMSGSGYGILMDLCLGLVGGLVGGMSLGLLGIHLPGLLGALITSTLGAVLLIWVVRMLKSRDAY
jgi:uncharacterized membrane protein YeaQ/YmgE (transglycosylase-associated protein family)